MLLPHFIIVGAQKSGTTSLYSYLSDHPEIEMSPLKETFFYSYLLKGDTFLKTYPDIPKSLDEYGMLWKREDLCRGEKTATYLSTPGVAKLIKKTNPKVKIIMILRNPVDRAYSHYMMNVRNGIEKAPFEEVLDEALYLDSKDPPERFGYIRNGRYFSYVKEYIDCFPQEQIQVILFDDFVKNTDIVLKRIMFFLNVNPTVRINTDTIYQKTGIPRIRVLSKMLYQDSFWKKTVKFILPEILQKRIAIMLNYMRFHDLKKPTLDQGLVKKLQEIYRSDLIELAELLQLEDLLEDWFGNELYQ